MAVASADGFQATWMEEGPGRRQSVDLVPRTVTRKPDDLRDDDSLAGIAMALLLRAFRAVSLDVAVLHSTANWMPCLVRFPASPSLLDLPRCFVSGFASGSDVKPRAFALAEPWRRLLVLGASGPALSGASNPMGASGPASSGASNPKVSECCRSILKVIRPRALRESFLLSTERAARRCKTTQDQSVLAQAIQCCSTGWNCRAGKFPSTRYDQGKGRN